MAYYINLDERSYPAGYADLRDSFYDGAGVYGQLVEGQWSNSCVPVIIFRFDIYSNTT